MSFYPKDICFLCNKPTYRFSEHITYCDHKSCSVYERKNNSVEFQIELNNRNYYVWIDYKAKLSVVEEKKFDVNNKIIHEELYLQENAVELPLADWIELIKRLEKLRSFK